MLLCIETHLAERAETRQLNISVDEHRRKQRQARGTGEDTTEPGSGSRDNERVKDDEFDFPSYNPKKQAHATADEDNWRKMKMESNGMNELSRVQHCSRTAASVRHPLSISNPQTVQAAKLAVTSG